jgi:hypothetical protein
MMVDNESARMKSPSRCDCCGVTTGEVVRLYEYRGLQHFVEWLCPYCLVSCGCPASASREIMACMLHEFERRIVNELNDMEERINENRR